MAITDAWGASWADTWALTWTYGTPVQPETSAGGAGQAGRGRGRRYPYLNILDDAHLLPQYRARQEQERQLRRPRRAPEAEPDLTNDPDIIRLRQYLEQMTGRRPK